MSEIPELTIDVWAGAPQLSTNEKDQLMDSEFRGILVFGPETLALDEKNTLPIVGFRVYSNQENPGILFARDAVVAVVRLDSNEVFVATAFPQSDEKPKKAAIPPKAANVFYSFNIELRSRIDELPWIPGAYASVILLLDQQSNIVRSQLTPGAIVDRDPAVAEFLKQRRPLTPPPEAIWPPLPPKAEGEDTEEPAAEQVEEAADTEISEDVDDGSGVVAEIYPNYREVIGAPAVPAEPGIEMSIERVVVASADAKCVLKGSFSLPVLERETVPPVPSEENASESETREWVDVGDPEATAVIPITLVLIGNTDTGPFVLRLRVPSYDAVSAGDEQALVTGTFAVDLFTLPDMPQLPQTYYIWAFSGEHIGGPLPVAIITEDLLQS